MITTSTFDGYEKDLQVIQLALKPVPGVFTNLIPGSLESPMPSLLVQLGADHLGNERIVSIMYMNLEDTEFEAIKMLQFYVEFPYAVLPHRHAGIHELFNQLK